MSYQFEFKHQFFNYIVCLYNVKQDGFLAFMYTFATSLRLCQEPLLIKAFAHFRILL